MKYSVELFAVKNNEIINRFKVYDYESDKIYLISTQNKQELIDEIINKFKETLKDFDNLIVNRLGPSYQILAQDYERKKLPEEYKELFEQSKKECEEYQKSEEGQKELLKYYMQRSLNEIQEIKDYAVKINFIDSQEFLDFMDELNKLSIDPDRK